MRASPAERCIWYCWSSHSICSDKLYQPFRRSHRPVSGRIHKADSYRPVSHGRYFSTAMALQHAPKALVFGTTGFIFADWLLFIIAMIACGFAGTWAGLHLLNSLNNYWFSRALNLILTILALRLLWQASMAANWWS